MITSVIQRSRTLEPGDLVFLREWDENVNDWIILRRQTFMIISVEPSANVDGEGYDAAKIISAENEIFEVYAGYLVKLE